MIKKIVIGITTIMFYQQSNAFTKNHYKDEYIKSLNDILNYDKSKKDKFKLLKNYIKARGCLIEKSGIDSAREIDSQYNGEDLLIFLSFEDDLKNGVSKDYIRQIRMIKCE